MVVVARAMDSARLAAGDATARETHRLVRSRHMADGEERDDCFQFQGGL